MAITTTTLLTSEAVNMEEAIPCATLPALLFARARAAEVTGDESAASITFLSPSGEYTGVLTLPTLLASASTYAARLLEFGLTSLPRAARDSSIPIGACAATTGSVVLSCFVSHQSHILLFWACILARIPFCPLPTLHADPVRRSLLLRHLQSLFGSNNIMVIGDAEGVKSVKSAVPEMKVITPEDLLKEVQSNTLPEMEYHPDEAVCMMLTSGSTGQSKAVVLTHATLLSSIRGKIGLHGGAKQKDSSEERFLNWIAFDHVACVSEIHLQALELGCRQYHVSPSAVIRNPCNLLEWTSTLQITFTFSPNFLIAQILRDISSSQVSNYSWDFSRLRALISGGESVPFSTAIAFADLIEKYGGRRNVLRAGFGMSETGAGCIYNIRDIPRSLDGLEECKYLSLGKCCDGVEMRIQDGQLQLQGTSVFRGYFGGHHKPFTSDGWFMTGDSCEIDEEGLLWMAGRDADRININGIKIPSGDIEIYLADTVRSQVYVSPLRFDDSATETYAIFYQGDVNLFSAVRNAATTFCSQAPHAIVPLPESAFVKSALGKVSRSQLAKSFLKGDYDHFIPAPAVFSDSPEDLLTTPLANFVATAVSETFNIPVDSIRRSQNIFDIGASSMHLIRLKTLLQESLSIADIPTIDILGHPEIGHLCDYLESLTSQTIQVTPTHYDPLVRLNFSGTKPPLFLIHPGVGEILVFLSLAKVLSSNRPIYALRARGFDHPSQPPFTTFSSMVTTYTSSIVSAFPSGPYYIAGYSFGAALAFDIAKSLEAAGKRVAWLGILNLPPHIQFRMNELTWSEVLLNICAFLSLVPAFALPTLRVSLTAAHPETSSDTAPPNPLPAIRWALAQSAPARLAELNLDLAALARWVDVGYAVNLTGRTFLPSGCVQNALTTVFCAIPLESMGTREEYKRERLSAWCEFSAEGRFEMVDVDGEHYTMLSEENVVSFASHLSGALQRAEGILEAASLTLGATPSADFDVVPIIDFSLASTNPDMYYAQLKFALEDVGFGIFVNVPGFSPTFQRSLFTLAEAFFSQPQEYRDQLGTHTSPALRGYFRADKFEGPHKAHAEAYRFGAEMPVPGALDDCSVPFWLKLHEGPNQWPPSSSPPCLDAFRSNLELLFARYHALNLTLNHHIAQLLSIPYSILESYYPEERVEFNSAIWHYFPMTEEICRSADTHEDQPFVQGMHAHRDPSTFLTCLIQSRKGLEVLNRRGRWVEVPMVEGGVVCNIGMQLMKLTGGKLVATTHRVNTLKIEKDRYTIPYVLTTDLAKPISPLSQFVSPFGSVSPAPHTRPPRDNGASSRSAALEFIKDPLVRSGYARLSLFPTATKKMYPREWEEAKRLGIV